ncbi:YcaO-like family protein [Rhodobacteraceae bacterium B1Z28]|uniref:YcaO-like family protein n=1 Tax=Ruegeria haliotis TaxID=2747601 RepID=A0ABX2PW03_9RHOB|nr:YcaO-like family protein [Ruegeria haliotis]NVO57826.1 YcaO-like family protein [Ruegeria haliotis]
MTDTLIERAETARLISKPSFAEFPKAAPIHAAFRLIELRDGTQPPVGAMARRLSFGTARTREDAARLAGFEAIERYALQFSSDAPENRESLIGSDGATHVMPNHALALGAPDTNGQITSKGAAAGPSYEAAALNAVLECLEHALDPQAYAYALPAEAMPQDLTEWLAAHLRQLDIHLAQVPGIGLLIRAVCADSDGGRPTYGTAFSANLENGIWHAASEAVVSWRNMVTLDHTGVTQDGMDEEEARLFQLYRGARGDRPVSPTARFDVDGWQAPEPTLGAALNAAAEAVGQHVAVFDMTAPEIPLPVVKAVPV